MTTIVYDHKEGVIAYDSRVTRGSRIVTDTKNKLRTVGDRVFIMSGTCSDIDNYVENYHTGEVDKDSDSYGFMVEDGKVYWVTLDSTTGKVLTSLCDYSESCGSGQDHAITAIDCGKSAVEAVELAIKRDNCSGGKVNEFHIMETCK